MIGRTNVCGGVNLYAIYAYNGSILKYTDECIKNPSDLGFTSNKNGTFNASVFHDRSGNSQRLYFYKNGNIVADTGWIGYGTIKEISFEISKNDIITCTEQEGKIYAFSYLGLIE